MRVYHIKSTLTFYILWTVVCTVLSVLLFLICRYSVEGYYLKVQYFNTLIHIPFICMAIYRVAREKPDLVYFKAFLAGILASTFASGVFAVFTVIYMAFIDPYYLTDIVRHSPLGEYVRILPFAAQVFMECTAAAVIVVLIAEMVIVKERPFKVWRRR